MSSTEELKAALLYLPEMALEAPTVAVADVWSRVAASFASLMQGSNNPAVPQVQAFLGQTSQIASELVGREDQLRSMIGQVVANM